MRATVGTFIGQPVVRKEDPELITGQARFIDNWTMPGMLWMALARPPYEPAVINAVIDAVSHLGVTAIEKPVSPERVWSAIQAAKNPMPGAPADRGGGA